MTMEMRLKERLVGATVLVLAAVLFIPMLLDGPGRNRQISQSVPLPEPEDGDERRTVRIDLDRGVVQAARANDNKSVEVDLTPQQEAAESPQSANAAPAATQQPDAVRRGEPTSSRPDTADTDKPAVAKAEWTVQAGAFSRQQNADALAGKLSELGYQAVVSNVATASGVHYRVRVGGYFSRDAAEREADEIRRRSGEPARAVPVD